MMSGGERSDEEKKVTMEDKRKRLDRLDKGDSGEEDEERKVG